jgi:hypothetical protein
MKMKIERKKLKITIESEGNPTQVLEANGMAAALLTDGSDDEHHSLKCLICGHMSLQDLMHLHEGVGENLIENLESTIMKELSPEDILRVILDTRSKKHESEG